MELNQEWLDENLGDTPDNIPAPDQPAADARDRANAGPLAGLPAANVFWMTP